MKRRQSSPVSIRVKSITSALPAAKRNLIPSRKSMRKWTGLAYPRNQGFSPTTFFFLSISRESWYRCRNHLDQSIKKSRYAKGARGEKLSFFINPEFYTWVILPILIFLARICDVSMETIRVIYIAKGIKISLRSSRSWDCDLASCHRSRDERSFQYR